MACCKMIDAIMEQFPLPFHYPVTLDRETLEFGTAKLAVELYQVTQGGNINKKAKRCVAYLNFCPWCGKGLRKTQSVPRPIEEEHGIPEPPLPPHPQQI